MSFVLENAMSRVANNNVWAAAWSFKTVLPLCGHLGLHIDTMIELVSLTGTLISLASAWSRLFRTKLTFLVLYGTFMFGLASLAHTLCCRLVYEPVQFWANVSWLPVGHFAS